jgi:transcription-repair coupling factor (superfamily II helicase)
MHEHEMERVMLAFVRHEADVLVSTTIIESGLDIPNVNTILIQDADRFGLADLHQLRGRVGRYKYRAYCYLLLPEDRPITPKAAKRLKAIEEYSELGAGFRIAMRDLEIRGAGNILGPEQSGYIAAVGYDMYCRMLEAAIRRMKELPAEERVEVEIDIGADAFISRRHVPSDRQRMGIYRQLARCRTVQEVRAAAERVRDMYGAMPEPAARLFELAELRAAAAPWKIRAILCQSPDLIFSIEELSLLGPLFADAPGSVRVADAKTVHLRLKPAYFEPPTLLAVLRKLLVDREPPPAGHAAPAGETAAGVHP